MTMPSVVREVERKDAARLERAWQDFHGARERALRSFAAVIVGLQAKGYSLQDLADVLGVSRQRVHQLLDEARRSSDGGFENG